MAWHCSPVLLLVVALSLSAPIDDVSPEDAPDLRLTIRAEPSDPQTGDEVLIRFVIRNMGTRDYDYDACSDECSLSFDLSVTTRDGEAVPDVRKLRGGGIVGSCLCSNGVLVSGASFDARIALNHRALIVKPGEYRVRGIYHLSLPDRTRGRRWPDLVSPEIALVVAPRGIDEMGEYIEGLAARLGALGSGPRDDWARQRLVLKLGYTGDSRIIPTVIEAMYTAAGVPARDVFLGFLPDRKASLQALLPVALVRGLSDWEMRIILEGLGATGRELDAVIDRSLAPNSPSTWTAGASGAMASHDPDRFTARLVAIARVRGSPARKQALVALTWNRSEEGLAALREALSDSDPRVRQDVANVIRNTYACRRRGGIQSQGCPLLDSDFDEALRLPPQFEIRLPP